MQTHFHAFASGGTDMKKEQNDRKNGVKILIVALAIVLVGAVYISIAKPWEKIGDIDDTESIDLTAMSGTMVYSYVYDMLYTRPEAYVGKSVKVRGQYNESYYTSTEQYYRFIIIKDAAACCAQGMEFVFDGGYPDENGAEIEAIGIFETYDELGTAYYRLNVSSLTVI
jgi:hypothetical protein